MAGHPILIKKIYYLVFWGENARELPGFFPFALVCRLVPLYSLSHYVFPLFTPFLYAAPYRTDELSHIIINNLELAQFLQAIDYQLLTNPKAKDNFISRLLVAYVRFLYCSCCFRPLHGPVFNIGLKVGDHLLAMEDIDERCICCESNDVSV